MDFRTLCHLARTRTSTLFTHVRIQSVTKHLRRDKTKVHKLGGKLGKERWRGQHAAFCTPSGRGLRVRVEMMGPGIYDNAGKTQSVLLMITFMISPHTRGTMRGRRSGAGRTVTVWPARMSWSAAAMLAGPEPTMAIFLPVRVAGGRSTIQPCSKPRSMMAHSTDLIATGFSMMPSTQAPSHGAGHTRLATHARTHPSSFSTRSRQF
jgi:hypothetical protein